MYRLAIELGLVNLSVESDAAKVVVPKEKSTQPTQMGYTLDDAVAIIEGLPPENQIIIKEVLSRYTRSERIVGVELNDALTHIIEAGVLTIVNDLPIVFLQNYHLDKIALCFCWKRK